MVVKDPIALSDHNDNASSLRDSEDVSMDFSTIEAAKQSTTPIIKTTARRKRKRARADSDIEDDDDDESKSPSISRCLANLTLCRER